MTLEVLERTPAGPDGPASESRKEVTVFLDGPRARIEEPSVQSGPGPTVDTVSVIRLGTHEVIRLDPDFRSYDRKAFGDPREEWQRLNRMYLDEIEQVPLNQPGRRARLIDELTDGPEKWRQVWALPAGPERKALVEKYRLPEEPPVVELRRTGGRREICGVECVKYEALENGEVTDSAWIAPRLPFDRRFYDFMELWGWLGPELAEMLRGVRGLPLATVKRARDGVEVEITAVALDRRDLDAGLFEPPEGYVERKARSGLR
jgi:hypothetical protein